MANKYNNTLKRSLEIRYRMLTIPALILLFGFIIFPILYNIGISFTNFSLLKKGWKFVGVRNYRRFFEDEYTGLVIKNTAKYVGFVVFFQFFMGFVSALCLSYIRRMRGIIAGVLFMPWVVSQVFATSAWRLLFNDSYGLINYGLRLLGMQPIGWLADNNLALYVVIMLNIWAGYGFSMTVLLGALKNVPEDLYEASRVDGAGWFRQLISITIPMIRYTILTNLIFISIATFNIFAYVFALTNGGPVHRTEVIGYTMYNTAFYKGAMGQGSAVATVMLLFNALMAIIYIIIFKSQDSDAI